MLSNIINILQAVISEILVFAGYIVGNIMIDYQLKHCIFTENINVGGKQFRDSLAQSDKISPSFYTPTAQFRKRCGLEDL
jgi:hypothetical protein